MHLFVTLLINKTPGSDNRHFLFHILKNEDKEEFLTGSTFYSFELIENSLLRKRLSQDALSKVHLSMYGSYFKFILLLLLSRDTDLNSWTLLWELFSFHNCSFSTERMDYQLNPLSEISNDA